MRVLVADDHDLVRELLGDTLSMDGIDVALAAWLSGALELVEKSPSFDLVLLDYDMPGMNGVEGLITMMTATGGKPVALLSGSASPEVVDKAIDAGAAGFIPKTLSARSMISAVRLMASGEVYAPVNYLQNRARETGMALSRRETEVLRGICDGRSNKEIARDLGLQEVTIKLHVKTLSRKLGARNRTHAAMIARDRALV